MGNIHSHKLLHASMWFCEPRSQCSLLTYWSWPQLVAGPLPGPAAQCNEHEGCHLLQRIMLYVPQKEGVKYMAQRAIICSLQISHKSWGTLVLHQGRLNSSSGVSMIAKCKIMQRHVVPMVRLSWSGVNPPLVAILLLHLRRLWHPPGEATAEDKIPICYLSL